MFKDFAELGEQPYSEEDAEWDAFVDAHPHGSVLQTTHWARLKNRFNWAARRVWLRRDGELVAGAQILFRSAYLGMVKIGYIPHGPLVDWDDAEQVDVLFNQIDQAVYKNKAGLLKIDPLLWEDEFGAERWRQVARRLDLRLETDAVQPPRTMLIDLDRPEDEILADMKSKTRYNIRLAKRKDVVVRRGDESDLNTFARLMMVTGERNEFGVHAPRYYQTAYEQFAPYDKVGLFIAEYEGEPLAGSMIFINGRTASYLYGGSNNKERQRMPTYAIQWEGMRWAKERGCTTYDMWGVPDHDEETLEAQFLERDQGLWGVYRFKRGFQGHIRRTVGTADRVYSKLLYKLYQRRRGSSE